MHYRSFPSNRLLLNNRTERKTGLWSQTSKTNDKSDFEVHFHISHGTYRVAKDTLVSHAEGVGPVPEVMTMQTYCLIRVAIITISSSRGDH